MAKTSYMSLLGQQETPGRRSPVSALTMGGEAQHLINAAHSRRVPRNRGKFWRGRTMQVIILIECQCHSGFWEKAGMKESGWESMECLEVGGRVDLERKGWM